MNSCLVLRFIDMHCIVVCKSIMLYSVLLYSCWTFIFVN